MKSTSKAAYGDFQTPPALARAVCRMLARRGDAPTTIVEPTCGLGHFVLAAKEVFGDATIVGRELNPDYVARARRAVGAGATIEEGDFFATDWSALLEAQRGPVMVLGNPPWVTNAELSVLGVDNRPARSNAQGLGGLAAMTGKSNFDISEWMLIHLLERGQGLDVTVAMLVKTTVARRLLAHAATQGLSMARASIHRIDAQRHFGASVDAGLFCFRTDGEPGPETEEIRCPVFASLEATAPEAELGMRDGRLVADVVAYDRSAAVRGRASPPWRSGIKHDCARVMELRQAEEGLVNGHGERVDVEADRVFGLLKSSDLRGEPRPTPRRWLVLGQRKFGQDTARLQSEAPSLWRYLTAHADALDGRRSSIYRSQPRFAVFGLGPYSFAPWKIAISGLAKHSRFTVVGPDDDGRPMMLDDTCYFVGVDDEALARAAHWLLHTDLAQQAILAVTFWDAKRPLTKDLLDRLDLGKLARRSLGAEGPPLSVREGVERWAESSGDEGTAPGQGGRTEFDVDRP